MKEDILDILHKQDERIVILTNLCLNMYQWIHENIEIDMKDQEDLINRLKILSS